MLRAHGGQWLVRSKMHSTRCRPGVGEHDLQQATPVACTMDQPPCYQSTRTTLYQ